MCVYECTCVYLLVQQHNLIPPRERGGQEGSTVPFVTLQCNKNLVIEICDCHWAIIFSPILCLQISERTRDYLVQEVTDFLLKNLPTA